MRPRRPLSPATLWLLRPAFRYSPVRGAYVLRFVGRKRGPVLVDRRTHNQAEPSR